MVINLVSDNTNAAPNAPQVSPIGTLAHCKQIADSLLESYDSSSSLDVAEAAKAEAENLFSALKKLLGRFSKPDARAGRQREREIYELYLATDKLFDSLHTNARSWEDIIGNNVLEDLLELDRKLRECVKRYVDIHSITDLIEGSVRTACSNATVIGGGHRRGYGMKKTGRGSRYKEHSPWTFAASRAGHPTNGRSRRATDQPKPREEYDEIAGCVVRVWD